MLTFYQALQVHFRIDLVALRAVVYLGLFKDHLATFWLHFGYISATFLATFWLLFGYFWLHFGHILSIF